MSAELQSLLHDLHNSDPMACATAPARQLLADWVQDHPAHAHTVVAELLRMMPELLAPILAEGLTMESAEWEQQMVSSEGIVIGSRRAGFRLTLRWHGLTVCQTEVRL